MPAHSVLTPVSNCFQFNNYKNIVLRYRRKIRHIFTKTRFYWDKNWFQGPRFSIGFCTTLRNHYSFVEDEKKVCCQATFGVFYPNRGFCGRASRKNFWYGVFICNSKSMKTWVLACGFRGFLHFKLNDELISQTLPFYWSSNIANSTRSEIKKNLGQKTKNSKKTGHWFPLSLVLQSVLYFTCYHQRQMQKILANCLN